MARAQSQMKFATCWRLMQVPGMAKVLIRRTGQEEFHARYIRDPHSATHRTLTGETSPQVDQKPVHHCRSAENRPLSASGQLSSFTVSDDKSLQWVLTAEAMTRRRSIFYFAARHTCWQALIHQLNRSSTHVVLSGVDRGRDTPPLDRKWEREFPTLHQWAIRL